jgi:hypothetical protein
VAPTHNRFFNDGSGNLSPAALQANGPVLTVNVHVPTALAELLAASGRPVPAPVTGFALIDTGATNTCVDDAILQKLGVSTIGIGTALTAAGPAPQRIYPARLEFPGEGLDLEFSSVAGVNLTGQVLQMAGATSGSTQDVPIVVLVGRDVLMNCVLIYNGAGGFFTLAV